MNNSYRDTDMDILKKVTEKIIGCAIEAHKNLGPGLLESIYKAQVLSYLKMVGKRLGLLINFNEVLLRNGLERLILLN